jgi:formylglycine-generating enzyme required for sulfatase activity
MRATLNGARGSALWDLGAAALAALILPACSPRPAGGDGGGPRPAAAVREAPARAAPAAATAPIDAGRSPAGDAAGGAQPARPAELPARWEGMLLVPAGAFTMGADDDGELDERPSHTVTLPAFYLDETEVTNEAYARCVDAGRCKAPDPHSADANGFGPDRRFRGPRQPASSLPWDSAAAYCALAGKRLPTEAELEKAARGPDGRRYPWGDDPPDPERAVFGSSVTADVGTHPAGRGPYGHLDLAGNVWEWTADVYDPYAYRRPGAPRGEPGGCAEAMAAQDELRRNHRDGFTGSNPIPTECERVLRGGAFNYPARGLRASNRVHHPGRYRLVMSGVRCAKDAEAVRQTLR